MADRDRWEERDRDADDWFVGADPSDYGPDAPRAAESDSPAQPAAADDWLDDAGTTKQAPRHRSQRERKRAKLALGLGVLAVIVLGSLAAAGVFTNARRAPNAVTTTPPTTTSSTASRPPPTKSVGVLPTSTLKPGDTGAQVVDLQHALARLGYAPGPADGRYGPATVRAVERLQRASGLSADGIFGPKTLTTLRRAAAGR